MNSILNSLLLIKTIPKYKCYEFNIEIKYEEKI